MIGGNLSILKNPGKHRNMTLIIKVKVKVKFVAKSLSVVIVHVSLSQTMDSYGNNQYGYIRMPVRALAERLPPHPRVAANFPRIPSAPPGFSPLPAHPPAPVCPPPPFLQPI